MTNLLQFLKDRKIAKEQVRQDIAYIQLNNLYLSIQRGDTLLTRTIYNKLNSLLNQFETHGDPMYDWWISEFQKLPGWLNV